MPRKIRDLIRDLSNAGFYQIPGGKGSHRNYTHDRFPGSVTISGQENGDAHPYQEKHVRKAIKKSKGED